MQTILKYIAPTIVAVFLLIGDIPLLPVELVPEAQAVFGVRRRTAVIAYSAGSAHASQAAAASASQQQPAQPVPAQSVSAVPVGTIVKTLPGKCVAVTVGNVQYQECGGSFYRTAFQGNNLVYVVVDRPI